MADFGFDHAGPRVPLVAGLLALSLLAGCGGKLNPLKWFGSRDKTVAEVSIEAPSDPRPWIDSISDVRLEKVPSGVLITAKGLAAAQGSWQAALVARPVDDGLLTLDFRAWPAPVGVVGTPRTREVTVGLHLSHKELAGVEWIEVSSAKNALTQKP